MIRDIVLLGTGAAIGMIFMIVISALIVGDEPDEE